MNNRLPNPLSVVFVILAVVVAFVSYNWLLLTRAVRLENASLGITQTPNGIQVQRNPLSLLGVTEYVTEESADGRPLAGGVIIGEIGQFEVFRGRAASEADGARFSTKDHKIEFSVFDIDKSGQISKSVVLLNTGKYPCMYEDLNLDGVLDVMAEGLDKDTQQYYVLVDDTWTPAIRCTENGAIIRKGLFCFLDGSWHLLIAL